MSIRIIHGDCRDVLRTLPDESVHCVVTSPPYYGLRDYRTAQWDGGDPACDHVMPAGGGRNSSGLNSRGGQAHLDWIAKLDKTTQFRDECGKCGARRIDRQIGLESTPDAYVAELVGVFREVKRVMRRDAVAWINLGDSFGPGKQLQGIPWKVAFALQVDGWILRMDCIWSKPNPMPESVTDRPTKAHEYLFLLSKSERYFFDQEAVREAACEASLERIAQPNFANQQGGPKDYRNGVNPNRSMRQTLENFAENPGRNIRSVWTVATHSFPEAHFATFPPALIEPCIKAGTSEKGCCAKCGAPWKRVVEKTRSLSWEERKAKGAKMRGNPAVGHNSTHGGSNHTLGVDVKTIGWSPSCSCNAAVVPATVLDPFFGAGTTGLVADRLQRNCIGIELNESYSEMAAERINREAGMFATVEISRDGERCTSIPLVSDRSDRALPSSPRHEISNIDGELCDAR